MVPNLLGCIAWSNDQCIVLYNLIENVNIYPKCKLFCTPSFATFKLLTGTNLEYYLHIIIADADNFMIFCESGRRLCHFVHLTRDSPAKVIPLKVEFDYAPAAISYDPKEKQIYWTDDDGNIYRAFLNNGSQEAVARGVSSPMGIEVDVIGRNIYFADNNGNNIRVASLDGHYQAILVDVQSPQSIALDSVEG